MALNGRLNIYDDSNVAFGVRPVVTLRPNVKALGKDLDGTWQIEIDERILKVPTPNLSIYDGTEQSISLNNFNSELMELSGITKATETGDYIATVSLKYPDKHTWIDGTTDSIDITWKLVKDTIYVTLYTDGTLGFSNNTDTIEGKMVSKSYGDIAKSYYTEETYKTERPWYADVDSITTVDFVNEIFPTYSTAYWFSNCKNLKTINNINNINTSSVVAMNHMFDYCEALSYVDVSTFDTRNVTNMQSMFGVCQSLTSLDLSTFDTRNVTNMTFMFTQCSKLKNIYVGPNWTTENADTTEMFVGCGTSSVTKK